MLALDDCGWCRALGNYSDGGRGGDAIRRIAIESASWRAGLRRPPIRKATGSSASKDRARCVRWMQRVWRRVCLA